MSNVISIKRAREIKETKSQDLDYQAKILSMSKVELLEEMVRFQEERTEKGALTVEMMVRGQYLFTQLEKSAETAELKSLTKAYRRHLSHELRAHAQWK